MVKKQNICEVKHGMLEMVEFHHQVPLQQMAKR